MIGAGYVGLVSGVCLSDFGHDVVCVEKNAAKLARLQAGEVPIYEPGLEDLLARNIEAGCLSFTENLAEAVEGADAIFIAVGTPTRRGDGHADLTYVMTAAEEIARALTGYSINPAWKPRLILFLYLTRFNKTLFRHPVQQNIDRSTLQLSLAVLDHFEPIDFKARS